ncbi:MAG: CpsD/CapB family tyrosine-protein kinase [bacterium]
MERLEAAMAKARAARGDRQLGAETTGVSPAAGSGAKPTPDTLPATLPDTAPGTAPGTAPQTVAAADWSVLPSIDISPRQARAKRINAVLGTEFASQYDILRSRVLRQMKDNKWTRLAVTSPRTKSGKTTISLNLALSLARNSDQKIILMDFDMRRPSLATLLNIKSGPDIAGLLRPSARLTDYAVRFGSNLAICSSRTPVRNSAELLQSKSTKEALDRIEAEWQPDIMIFDTPPMQGNDDNLGFFGHIDCALIIAGAGGDTLAQIDRCEQEVSSLTNVLGTILNKCKYFDKNTGYDSAYY